MKFAPGVDDSNVHPGVWWALGVMDAEHQRITEGKELYVTCLAATRLYPSFHTTRPVQAADCRAWLIPEERRAEFAAQCRVRLGQAFHLVWEPHDLSDEFLAKQGRKREKVPEHFHVELRHPGLWGQQDSGDPTD